MRQILAAVIVALAAAPHASAEKRLVDHFRALFGTFGQHSTTKVKVVSGPKDVKMRNGRVAGKVWAATCGTFRFKITIQDSTGVEVEQVVQRLEKLPMPYIRACEVVSDETEDGIAVYASLGGAAAHGGKSYINMVPRANALVLAHEAGHALEQAARESDAKVLDKWARAIQADKISVSAYGDRVRHEDLGDFAKIYAVCLDAGPEHLARLKKLSPARYALWERILTAPPAGKPAVTPPPPRAAPDPKAPAAAETIVDQSRRIISPYKAVFRYPPRAVPCKTAVDGPLLGNGDMGVCIGAIAGGQRFWLAKNDFWKLTDRAERGGPRVFGGIDVTLAGLGGGWPVEQHLYDAVTTSTFQRAKPPAGVVMRSWVAATENVLVLELAASGQDAEVKLALWVQEGNGAQSASGTDGGAAWATRRFAKDVNMATEAACAAKPIGAKGATFTVKAGQTVTVVAAMRSAFQSKTPLADVRKRVASLDAAALGELRKRHAAWWRDFWAKSCVEIGDPVLEQRYYLSQYVMACASRDPDFPPGLFGTWITTDAPGWMGDYHLNYNHMAPYYGLYSSNHIAQADPYHAPILDFRPRAQWYAKNALNCRGVYYPVGIGPKGIETTLNYPTTGYAKPQHVEKGGLFYHQKSNAAYCLVNVAMRWYHTYDKAYAKQLYPLVRDVADFWEDYLKFENGRYVIYKDSVHERSGNGNDFNSIVSLGLVRNAFELAIDMSREMGIDADRHAKWKHILDHLSTWSYQTLRLPHQRGEDRSVKKPERKVFRYTERGTAWWRNNTLGIQHIYPAGAIGLDSPPDVLEVSRNTIDVRNGWFDGNGMNSFYPAAVRVGYDPKVILAKLREMVETRGAPNGFIKGNPHGIENCSIVPNTIDEMLCMGHRGVLRVFAVWPRDKDARFANLRARGAFLVDSELAGGEVRYVRIRSERGRPCTVRNPWPGREVAVLREGVRAETVSGPRFTLKTRVDEEIKLLPRAKP